MTGAHLRYDRVAVTLHWGIALLILGLLAMGYFLDGMPKGEVRSQLFLLHKSFGLLVLLLTLFRFYWQSVRTSPPGLPGAAHVHKAANLVHAALYLLPIIVPVIALAAGSMSRGIDFFFLHFEPFLEVNKALAQSLMSVHGLMAYFLASLLLLHLAAVALHQFYWKDGILERMRF